MGDASPPAKEHIVILLPLPEPKEILDGLRKKHPNITIKYHFLDLKARTVMDHNSVPDGTALPLYIYCYFR
jgi:hypothetical protein